jgi:hypothetical protein
MSAGYNWKGTIEIMSQDAKLEPKTESNKILPNRFLEFSTKYLEKCIILIS